MLGSRATLELEPSYFKIFSIRSSILAILANLIVNHVHQVAMPALRRLLFSSPTLYSPTQRPAVYLNVAVPHGNSPGDPMLGDELYLPVVVVDDDCIT